MTRSARALTLGQVADIEMGTSPPGASYNKDGLGTPLLNGPTEFTDGHPIPQQWTTLPKRVCRTGDILICVRGASTGRMNIADRAYCIGRGVAAIRDRDDARGTPLLQHLIKHGVASLLRSATGSTFAAVDRKALSRLPVPVLSTEERVHLGELFNRFDTFQQQLSRLFVRKKAFKRALMQELLTGRRRFRGGHGAYRVTRIGQLPADWVVERLGAIAQPLTLRNPEGLGASHVMGVIKGVGLEPMRDRVRAADLRRYQVVPADAFAYNPMRLNIGSIARNRSSQSVLVSPDYVVFQTNPGSLLPAFLDQLRHTRLWQNHIDTAGSGSVRVRIYFDTLSQMLIPLPPIEEQGRIVQVLQALDSESEVLQRSLDAHHALKRGLMQRLLSGDLDLPDAVVAGAAATIPDAGGNDDDS